MFYFVAYHLRRICYVKSHLNNSNKRGGMKLFHTGNRINWTVITFTFAVMLQSLTVFSESLLPSYRHLML